MILSEIQDYYNIKKTRNADNTDMDEYNCGGYALNTFAWYTPYEGGDIEIVEDQIVDFIQEGLVKEEIYQILLKQFTDYMLKDFNNLRVIKDKSEIKDNERLIYFRFFYELVSNFDDNWEGTADEYDYVHADFHYRFYEDGHWHEKNGSSEIHTCDGDAEDRIWVCGTNIYDSPIIKFALRI